MKSSIEMTSSSMRVCVCELDYVVVGLFVELHVWTGLTRTLVNEVSM